MDTPLNTASFDGDLAINFEWGAQSGVDDVELSAKVTVNGVSAQIKPAYAFVSVDRPWLQWDIRAKAELTRFRKLFWTCAWIRNGEPRLHWSGIHWTFTMRQGGGVTGGTLAVEQIMTSGSYYYTDANGVYHSVFENATFPLLDIGEDRPVPWYQNKQDNPLPGWDSPTNFIPEDDPKSIGMKVNFTDYVMYNDGGDYVSVAHFSWGFDVAYNFVGTPQGWVENSRPELKSDVILSSELPPAYNGKTYQYGSPPQWVPPPS